MLLIYFVGPKPKRFKFVIPREWSERSKSRSSFPAWLSWLGEGFLTELTSHLAFTPRQLTRDNQISLALIPLPFSSVS